jgi:hypothetical protein
MVDSIVTIPLGLTTYKNGEISFKIKDYDNLRQGMKIYLHDAATGINKNLLPDKEYNIYLEAGEYAGRFSIRLINNIPDLPDIDLSETFHIYYANGYLEANIGYLGGHQGVLYLFDLSGRKLLTQKVLENGHYKINPKVSTGIYIVTLLSGNEVETKKILIKQ